MSKYETTKSGLVKDTETGATGVFRTVGGRRIFIKEGQDLATAMKESGKFSKKQVENKRENNKIDKETEITRKAIAEKLKEEGAQIDNDGNVTLYHITSPENFEKIVEQGKFIGNQSPIGGGSVIREEIGDRSFFTYDKEWVENWKSSDDDKIITIKVPAEYIRQGAKNEKEIYIEGDLKKQKNNIWKTDKLPTSTFYDRTAVKEYKRKHNID